MSIDFELQLLQLYCARMSYGRRMSEGAVAAMGIAVVTPVARVAATAAAAALQREEMVVMAGGGGSRGEVGGGEGEGGARATGGGGSTSTSGGDGGAAASAGACDMSDPAPALAQPSIRKRFQVQTMSTRRDKSEKWRTDMK